MRKLGMVLILLLAPNFSWGLSWSLPDNQGLYSGTTLVAFNHGMLVTTRAEHVSSPSILVARAESQTRQNSSDSDEPDEDECESEGPWAIGEIQLITQSKANPPLEVRSAGPSSLNSYNFVGKVGGVSFEQVAIPDTELAAKPLVLSYDPAAPDGSRLVVQVGTTTVRSKIADWLLIPIAHFADSDFTAATSLFGDGPDSKNFYYIQYHPAFQNTLLGLRLFQADILLMNARQNRFLPKRNGKVVLGKGENLPIQNNYIDDVMALSQIMAKQQFTSWVLTDTDAPSSFFIQDGEFQVRTVPYYYFWRRNENSLNQHQEKVDAFNSRVGAYNLKVTTHKNKVNQFNSLARRFNANNASVSAATLDRLQTGIQRSESELVAFEQELERVQMDLKEGVTVNPVPALTNALKNQSDLLQTINPVVYNAVQATAGYASFFRYIKFNHPYTWKAFLTSMAKVTIHPAVKAPTQMPRRNP
ncbi:MAG: hypothetical protein O7F12_14970 [Nitrospirae bacterium]|nr:hypothetical protein [Nitrospirota bacterium]